MKKTDVRGFTDFMTLEAQRYERQITKEEILTWFETFPRVTFSDFQLAWEQHRKGQWGGRFPTPNDLLRLTKQAGIEAAERDWRCGEEVNDQRCGFRGSIKPQGEGTFYCAAHYRLKSSAGYTSEKSMQIIEASREYVPPKSALELMERGEKQRAESAARWRKAVGVKTTRQASDSPITIPGHLKKPEDAEADQHVASADAARLAEVNFALAAAAQEEVQ